MRGSGEGGKGGGRKRGRRARQTYVEARHGNHSEARFAFDATRILIIRDFEFRSRFDFYEALKVTPVLAVAVWV